MSKIYLQTKSDNTLTTTAKTVAGAINEHESDISGLSTNKQNATDNTLTTTAKTVVGAINEHESDITSLNTNKQNATDNTLTTTVKTVVGAINEHESDISSLNEDKVDKADYNPEEKTSFMTQKVGKDANGKLWTTPFIYNVTTFEQVREVCRKGVARDYIQVGQEFTVGDLTIPAKVMGFIDNNRSGSLKIKDSTLQQGVIFQFKDNIENIQFDAAEAFYSNAEGLPSGSYSFVLGEHSWVSADVGKTFYFTLTQPLPAGGQLMFLQGYNVTLENASIKSYSGSSSTTAIEVVTISSTAIEGATNLGTLRNSFSGNFNSCQRAFLGSNRWKESALRQRLNSDAVAGAYWIGQNVFDRPPSWNASGKGFLNGLPTTFTDYIVEMEIDTYRNTVCDGGGLDTTTDKIFLVGKNELFMTKEGADNGVAWDYYKDGSTSAVAHNGADPIRIKKTGANPQYWLMRSPYVGNASYVRNVYLDGSNYNINGNNSYGVAPAFVIA